MNEDGSNVRKVKDHAEGESCTHEFWVPNGSALVYVSYLKGEQGRTISRYNPESGVNEEIMPMPACSHLMSNFDGTLLVGDGSGTPVDVKDTGATPLITTPISMRLMWRRKGITASRATIPRGRPLPTAARSRTRIHRLPRMTAQCYSVPIKTANRRSISPNCPSSAPCCNPEFE